MMGGSSPSGQTTTVQKADPWSGQQPMLLDIYGQAQGLDQNAVPQYFPGPTYAPLLPQQYGLINSAITQGNTKGNSGINAANSSLTDTLSPGYTSGTSGAFGQGQGVLSNELNPGYLNPWNSPSFQTVVGNTLASALPAATAGFNNGGRADSGLATRAATMAATDAVGNLAQNQYNTNQAIQNAAVGQASNNYLTQQGNQLKGAAIAPLIDAQQFSDITGGLTAGGAAQQDVQNQIAADMARYNYGQMLPWNQLGLYQQMVQGGGSPGGTTSTSQPYFSNPTANLLSAGTGLLGAGAAVNSLFPAFFPAIGAMFSDRRLKTDIERIGESDSGFPLYIFRYKGESPMARHIGLIAQDVEKARPGAVIDTPAGKAVHYGMALAA